MKILVVHFGDYESFVYLQHCLSKINNVDYSFTLLLNEYELDKETLNCPYPIIWCNLSLTWFQRRKLMKRMNALEFDTLLDVQRDFFPFAYKLGRKLKIDRKIGYNFAGKSKPYTDPISKKKEEHLLHFYALGIRVLDSEFNLRTLPKTLDQTKELAFIFNLSASIDGEVWAEENWLQLIQHLTLKTFNKYILFKGDLPEKLQVELERNSTVFWIDSGDEKIQNSILITLVNDIYFESILNKQTALLLDNKSERRKLRRPIVEGSMCVTPRFQGDGIKNIQFDTVLKAVREILYEVIE